MWNSHKIWSVKDVIIKESATNVFQVCMSIVYDSFILEISIYISIRLHCYCGNNVKYGLFSKHLFQRKRQYGGWKKSHSNEKLLEKITSSSYHMEQKTSIETSCIYNIHTGEKVFCSSCF